MKLKYIPGKGLLKMWNDDSIKRGCNQVIEPAVFDRIPDASYPITQSILHSDIDVRCTLVINDKGDEVLLDLALSIYNALPEMEIG